MFDIYQAERESLTESDIDKLLEKGRKGWDLAPVLRQGGGAIFPHTYLKACGHHIAAVVDGCLQSGTDTVLALGVVHSLSQEIAEAREKERQGQYISSSSVHGIFGPGISLHACWRHEYSLLNFEFLWHQACKRKGGISPKLILRYPALVGGRPEQVSGVKELVSIAKDAVVVATGDLCHNGIAYRQRSNQAVHGFGAAGMHYAMESIAQGFKLLDEGRYMEYMHHCYSHVNDSMDSATMLHYLIGPVHSKIQDLQLVDVADLFEDKPPLSWVAATLATLEKNHCFT